MIIEHSWWDDVTATYCDICKKLTTCYHYQGHFICDICDNITGFYITPMGFPKVEQPVKWDEKAKNLITVEYVIEDNDNYE